MRPVPRPAVLPVLLPAVRDAPLGVLAPCVVRRESLACLVRLLLADPNELLGDAQALAQLLHLRLLLLDGFLCLLADSPDLLRLVLSCKSGLLDVFLQLLLMRQRILQLLRDLVALVDRYGLLLDIVFQPKVLDESDPRAPSTLLDFLVLFAELHRVLEVVPHAHYPVAHHLVPGDQVVVASLEMLRLLRQLMELRRGDVHGA
mmetsp:Transcript_86589/g.279536  ORF Transcript_86589/g.279536 Transcript_86589/m.279536 type:complete len:203 (-) Transcript_86589:407-1015(-)